MPYWNIYDFLWKKIIVMKAYFGDCFGFDHAIEHTAITGYSCTFRVFESKPR